MDAKELKFLLKLLSFEEYRAPLAKIQPTPNMKASERNGLCRQLRERELVACVEEVTRLTIAPPGESLLKLDTASLPVSKDELKVLRASAKGKITPRKTYVPTSHRQAAIQGLADRGFIKALERKIVEVALSERGKKYLLEEYESVSTSSSITLKMLSDYLRFMRKQQSDRAIQDSVPAMPAPEEARERLTQGDAEILQAILDLDRELGTDNYLPIFQLRNRLQPALTRSQLDEGLYSLQRQNRIELSSLQEGMHYTKEQIDAGIERPFGGKLFFIIVN